MIFTQIKPCQWNLVKEIYMEAFPKAERKPFFLLKKSKRIQVFTAIEENEVLGFAVTVPFHNLVMVDYLAVNSKIRSKGTGSFLLQELCNTYQGKKLVLLIEQLDDSAKNQQQRLARRKFYLKNGFTSSGTYSERCQWYYGNYAFRR